MQLFKKLLVPVFLCFGYISMAQLQVTEVSNAQTLVQKLLGEGVTVSNITISGSPQASGTFKHLGGTNLGMDSGIVLASGRVKTSGGSYGVDGSAGSFASSGMGTPGDAQLNALTNGQQTYDAIILEFDFVPLGDTIKFNYVFSSEEYPEFNCTNFNDVFAFFISGPGITGVKNMALVPGTNIPVAINSINNGIPAGALSTCQAMGPGSPFPQYYWTNTVNPYLSHDGHTVILTALSKVEPCQTYHLKIAIADAGDSSYDSAVFLEAKSLKSDPIEIETTLPVLNGLPYMVEGCNNGGIKILRSRKSPFPQDVDLYYAGTVINGVDVQMLPLVATIPADDSVLFIPIFPIADGIPEDPEILKIYVSNGCALTGQFYLDSIEIMLRDYDTLAVSPGDTSVCKNSQVQLSAGGTYTDYEWLPATYLNNNTDQNPVATPGSTTKYVVTASIGDCKAKDSVTLIVKDLELLGQNNVKCAGGTSGDIHVSGGGEWQGPVQYSINNGSFGSDSSFSNLPVGTYVVKIKDASNCIDSVVVQITQDFTNLELADSIVTASCNGGNGQIFLEGSGGLGPYSYSTDGVNYTSGNQFIVSSGNYNVYVQDDNGCVSSHPVAVGTDPPITVDIDLDPELCLGRPEGTIVVNAAGGNNIYEYSVDGTNFQSSGTFTVNTSPLTVTVRDDKGCQGTKTIAIPFNDSVYVNAGSNPTICEGSSYTFNTSYNGSTIVWQPAPTLNNPNIASPTVNPVNTATYYVKVTKDFCDAYDTVTVFVNPAPVPNAGTPQTICFGRTINLQGSGGTVYDWSPSSQMTNPNSANPEIKPVQTTTYQLHVTDANGCTSLQPASVTITVTPPIQAFAGRDTFIAIGQPLQLQAVDVGNAGVTIYQWMPPTGLDDPNIPNPVATLTQDQLYTVVLRTPDGCEGMDDILVKVFMEPELYVPTGFTPNNDGRNDVLRPIVVGMKEFRYFRVYNRWGEMIFSTSDPNRGWDGTIAGVKQATGTYLWIVEAVDYRGKLVVQKGTTTLIR